MKHVCVFILLSVAAAAEATKLTPVQVQALQSAGSMEIDAKDPDDINKAMIEAKHVTGKNITVTQKVFSADGTGHYTLRVEN